MSYIGNRPDAFQYTSTSYQQLSGDGVTTTFTLSRQVSANGDIEVVVNNVPQEPGVAYYVSNLTNLNFTAPPSAAANNIYIVYRAYVQSGIAPAANTVTTSAIAANTIQPWQLTNSLLNPIVNTFTANGTGTTYTLAFTPPSANAVVVTINGITQNHPENYSTNDNVLTFTDAPAANSVIRVLQQAVIGTSIVPIDGSVTNSKLASGLTLTGDTTLTGNLSVGGATTFTGGLNIDNNTLVVDGVNNRVGIGTSSPNSLLEIKAGEQNTPNFRIYGTYNTAASLYGIDFYRDTDSGTNLAVAYTKAVRTGGNDTGLVFGTSTTPGTVVERMRITAAGDVGIGTTTPGAPLQARGVNVLSASTRYLKGWIGGASSWGANAYEELGVGFSGIRSLYTSGDNWDLTFATGTSAQFAAGTQAERMRITSGGDVGIGTSSPSATLHVLGSGLITTSSGSGFLQLGTASGRTQYQYITFGGGLGGTDYGWQIGRSPTSGGLIADGFYIYDIRGNATRFAIDLSGNVGIGTSSPATRLDVSGTGVITSILSTNNNNVLRLRGNNATNGAWLGTTSSDDFVIANGASITERMRITSAGALLVAKNAVDFNVAGFQTISSGNTDITRSGGYVLSINRLADDGNLVEFYQASTLEGTISVSGTTVSYNGGHLSRYAQTLTPKDNSLLKGTVLSNLDEMNEYVDAEGNPVPNEQLNKVKVSDVEGDVNVAGVFVNWSHDEQHNVDEINMAMTGDMIIRIAQGVVVQKGDLLMSAGDGTAKPQGDDIVRSKTVAKVTSNHVTCTYADGSYCVPCVLMAC